MASYTPNYNLKKPADADSYDIADANGNMDIIDGALNTLNSNKVDRYDYTHSTSNDEDAMKACFDLLPAGVAVCGRITGSSQFFYTAYTYAGSHNYGSMIATLFNGNVKVMSVSNGTKTIRTIDSNMKVVQLYYNGSLNLEQGTEITLSDSVRNYDILILEMYVTVSGGGGTRKFSTVALKPYITNDDGAANNYIEASVFYSSSYNAGIGFTTNGNKITVAEVNKTGYPYIKGITVYGIKMT